MTTTRPALTQLPRTDIDQNDLTILEQVILFLFFCSPDVAIITGTVVVWQMVTGFFGSATRAFWIGMAISAVYCALAALVGILNQFLFTKNKHTR